MAESSQNIKRRPDCEEAVPLDVTLCRHCGYLLIEGLTCPVTTSELADRAYNQLGRFVRLLTLGAGFKPYPQ